MLFIAWNFFCNVKVNIIERFYLQFNYFIIHPVLEGCLRSAKTVFFLVLQNKLAASKRFFPLCGGKFIETVSAILEFPMV